MDKTLYGNAIIGQSGGPTAAINATLSGVMQGAFSCGHIDKVYGMRHGKMCIRDSRDNRPRKNTPRPAATTTGDPFKLKQIYPKPAEDKKTKDE